jgi:hypothetical protein
MLKPPMAEAFLALQQGPVRLRERSQPEPSVSQPGRPVLPLQPVSQAAF